MYYLKATQLPLKFNPPEADCIFTVHVMRNDTQTGVTTVYCQRILKYRGSS